MSETVTSVDVLLHQDVENRKAGETVEASSIQPDRLTWLIVNGYASTKESREGIQAALDITVEPSEPGNESSQDGPERVNTTPPAFADAPSPPEAFDPATRKVKEIQAYLSNIPEGAGRDKETARVTAVEAKGKNRSL